MDKQNGCANSANTVMGLAVLASPVLLDCDNTGSDDVNWKKPGTGEHILGLAGVNENSGISCEPRKNEPGNGPSCLTLPASFPVPARKSPEQRHLCCTGF